MRLITCPYRDVRDVTLCRCSPGSREMIHSADASLYPQAGFFRIGRVLYNARKFYGKFGRHMWEMFIHNPTGVGRRYVYHRVRFGYYRMTYDETYGLYDETFGLGGGCGMSLGFNPTVNGVLLSVSIRRIQRAMRVCLRRRQEARSLAVAMGLHERLGGRSCLLEVPVDVLGRILNAGC